MSEKKTCDVCGNEETITSQLRRFFWMESALDPVSGALCGTCALCAGTCASCARSPSSCGNDPRLLPDESGDLTVHNSGCDQHEPDPQPFIHSLPTRDDIERRADSMDLEVSPGVVLTTTGRGAER